jgi:transcriptional regulator of acetoin/glycerol metabolism
MAQGSLLRTGDLGLHRSSGPARLEDLPLEEVERVLIRKALERHEGNVSQAAKALGLSRSALYRRLQHHGL